MTEAEMERKGWSQQIVQLQNVSQELVLAKEKNQELLCKMSELCAILDEKESDIQKCFTMMENQNKRTQDIESVLRAHQLELEAEISHCETIIQQQRDDIQTKNKELSVIKARHNEELTDLHDAVSALTVGINSRDEILLELKADMEANGIALEERQSEIASLKSQLASVKNLSQNGDLEHADFYALLPGKDSQNAINTLQCQQLEREIATVTSPVNDKEAELAQLRREIDNLKAELMTRDDELSVRTVDLSQLREELSSAHSDLVTQQAHMMEMEEELSSLRVHNSAMDERAGDKQRDMEQLQTHLSNTLIQLNAQEEVLTARDADIELLHSEVSSLREQVTSQGKALSGRKADIKRAEKKLSSAQAELLDRQADVSRLEAELTSLQTLLHVQRNSTNIANEAIASLQADLGALTSEMHGQAEELSSSQTELTRCRQQVSTGREDVQRVEQEMASLQLECSLKDDKLSARNVDLLQLQNELSTWRTNYDGLRIELAAREEDKVHLDAESVRTSEALSAQAADVQRLEDELAALRSEVQAKEGQAAVSTVHEQELHAAEVASLQAELRSRDVDVQGKDEELLSLRADLSARDVNVSALRDEIARLEGYVTSLLCELSIDQAENTQMESELDEWKYKDLVLEVEVLKRTVLQREEDLVACRSFHAASLAALKGELTLLSKRKEDSPWSSPGANMSKPVNRFATDGIGSCESESLFTTNDDADRCILPHGPPCHYAPTTPPAIEKRRKGAVPVSVPTSLRTPMPGINVDNVVLQRVKEIENKVAVSPQHTIQPTLLDSLAVTRPGNVCSGGTPGRPMKGGSQPVTPDATRTDGRTLSMFFEGHDGSIECDGESLSVELNAAVHSQLIHARIVITSLQADIQSREIDFANLQTTVAQLSGDICARDVEIQRLREELISIQPSHALEGDTRSQGEECDGVKTSPADDILKRKDYIIYERTMKLDSLQQQLEFANGTLAAKQLDISVLEKENTSLNEALDAEKRVVHSTQQALRQLHEQVAVEIMSSGHEGETAQVWHQRCKDLELQVTTLLHTKEDLLELMRSTDARQASHVATISPGRSAVADGRRGAGVDSRATVVAMGTGGDVTGGGDGNRDCRSVAELDRVASE